MARIVFNNKGFQELTHSAAMNDLLLSEGQAIADRASSQVVNSKGYECHTRNAGSRLIAFVGTTDKASMEAESENKVLSRAVIPHG